MRNGGFYSKGHSFQDLFLIEHILGQKVSAILCPALDWDA